MIVNALFIDPKGHYPELLGPENCWDVERDARLYLGPHPVVAHPPCNLWVNMAAVNWKRYKRQKPAWYLGGDDDGSFESALRAVVEFGGVLEHPAGTHAWTRYGLGRPTGVGWYDVDVIEPGVHEALAGWVRCWVCEVWQSAYGHPARKRTWLLYCGKRPSFELRWERRAGTHQIGWFDRNKPTLSKREAMATPVEFAKELIRLAEWSRG